jgi:hypothetical protein
MRGVPIIDPYDTIQRLHQDRHAILFAAVMACDTCKLPDARERARQRLSAPGTSTG